MTKNDEKKNKQQNRENEEKKVNVEEFEEQVPVESFGVDEQEGNEKGKAESKEKDVRLIPFTVQAVEEEADHVPEGVDLIEAPYYWSEGYEGEDVVIAVLDTGIEKDHPDLQDRIIGGKNFVNYEGGENDYNDLNGHGTHVAGTIAGNRTEKSGIVGVAPKAKLLVLKVLDRDGSGYFNWIIEAIKYATKWRGGNGEKVRVISMSLGGPYHLPELQNAVEEAVANDIAVVVAAGNEGDGVEESHEFSYPASYNSVISVAASTIDGKLAPFSNNNKEVDVTALGVDVLSSWPGKRYARISGTSMATPHVAGALALLIQRGEKEFGRTLTESEIYALLVKSSVELGFKRSSEGHGLVRLNYMEKLRDLVDYIHVNF